MRERLRAPLAAAVAVLIGGDLAAFGPWTLLDAGRFLFPYLWLFLAFEALRRRRGAGDGEAFLVGAAVGFLHDGVFAKTLQDGVFFLGVNWLASVAACFDWGLTAVVALHVADAILPRGSAEEPSEGTLELAALVFIPAGALLLYLYDALIGRTRVERMLGPSWLLADVLFAAAAAFLIARALSRERREAEESSGREDVLWALGAFCAWLPGARLAARAGGPGLTAPAVAFAAIWTGFFGAWLRRLRSAAGVLGEPKRASRPILALAAWRLLCAAAVWAVFGSPQNDGRAAPAYAFFADLPARLVFLEVFLSSRLSV